MPQRDELEPARRLQGVVARPGLQTPRADGASPLVGPDQHLKDEPLLPLQLAALVDEPLVPLHSIQNNLQLHSAPGLGGRSSRNAIFPRTERNALQVSPLNHRSPCRSRTPDQPTVIDTSTASSSCFLGRNRPQILLRSQVISAPCCYSTFSISVRDLLSGRSN